MEFSIFGKSANQWAESEIIYGRLKYELNRLGADLTGVLLERLGRSRKNDILIWLPYWLTYSFRNRVPLNVLRACSVGNLFGAAYFLMQDKLIDRQPLRADAAERDFALLGHLLYYKWLREYHRLFDSSSAFWVLFERYMVEYTCSLAWEKREHWNKLTEFKEEDLHFLGQKLSPLKMTSSAICLVNNRSDAMSLCSEIIEQFHIAYQLADDVRDWKEDLERKNFTYFLTRLNDKGLAGGASFQEYERAIRSSTVPEEVLAKSDEYYERARRLCADLECKPLVEFIEDAKDANAALQCELKGRQPTEARMPQRLVRADIHVFSRAGQWLAFDAQRHRALHIDSDTASLLSRFPVGTACDVEHILNMLPELPSARAHDVLEELVSLEALAPPPAASVQPPDPGGRFGGALPHTEAVVTLAVQLTTGDHDSVRSMSPQTVKLAVRFLLERSDRMSQAHVEIFDIGNPDNKTLDLLRLFLRYGRQEALKVRKQIAFSISADLSAVRDKHFCQLLRTDELSMVTLKMSDDAQQSLEGDEPLRSAVRNLGCARPTLKILFQGHVNEPRPDSFFALLADLHVSIASIDAEEETGQRKIIEMLDHSVGDRASELHLRISNLSRVQDRVTVPLSRRYFCDAGKSLLAVSADGILYPCERFLKTGTGAMGSLWEGIGETQGEYLKRSVGEIRECCSCWARSVCGGGCLYWKGSRSSNGHEEGWCNFYRQRVERAIALAFSSSEEARESSQALMKADLRVCDLT